MPTSVHSLTTVDPPSIGPRRHASICREATVALWVCRRLSEAFREKIDGRPALAHERRVAEVASTLFDLSLDAGLHDLGRRHRQRLRLAALVHDVGRSVDDGPGHAAAGAKLLLSDRALPIRPAERRVLAYLTRYHRGPVVDPCDDWTLADAEAGDAGPVRLLLAMLRAADGLDGRRHAAGRLVLLLRRRTLTVHLYPGVDALMHPPKPKKLLKKFAAFREHLGVDVTLVPHPAPCVAMVG